MRVSESLPWVFLLIMSLVVAWLMLVLTTETKVEVEDSADVVNIKEEAGFGTIEIDETTGCEYFIFRNIMTPRVDETGIKVRGCKGSER